ncbi:MULTISPECIES: MarR family transcriptional regulator [Glutamicibacter]|uniref:HTH marR-type domain-containing protein n=1 Tax=Glutamicibacter creatinolyticus TaxID=162496 RepID=A0A5B7WUW9_9MICC|nr:MULTISPECIES: MarR family transcriptional regulator [Glutamicibacter]QCY47095.1 Hypothetical protein GcLGCM259_1362 [Glutamicibacter creatinolyticus]TLK56384.1 MarR family transcriptional regulator [Glutamicibacter sp. V16R2B1]
MQERPLGLMIWLRMARFVQRSNQISNEYLGQSGLTAAQFEALNHIRVYQPVTQSDLAARLLLSGGGVSRMLSRLEDEGLIKRTPDWKTKYISLTDEGREKLQSVYLGQVALQASMFEDVLDDKEQKQLYALMLKVHKNSVTKQAPPKTESTYPTEPPSHENTEEAK